MIGNIFQCIKKSHFNLLSFVYCSNFAACTHKLASSKTPIGLSSLHPLPLGPAVALVGGAALLIPGAAGVAFGSNVIDLDRLKSSSNEFQFTLAAPPLAGGADLTGYRYIVHSVAPFEAQERMPSPDDKRPRAMFRRGDWYA